jgi:ABC-type transporter Mla maintaining outer membrane lipid asymmetry permease subunit MlaE
VPPSPRNPAHEGRGNHAITTLGLSPLAVLVIPRILALLPCRSSSSATSPIAGGMLVVERLDISKSIFMDRWSVLDLSPAGGLGKAPVFAIFIALIACRMGLSVTATRAASAPTPPPPWCRAWLPSSSSTQGLP